MTETWEIGSIDNSPIGAVTPATGDFTTATVTTVDIGSTVVVTGTLDEDNMVSNSAVSLATQQSIKAYSDLKLVIASNLSDVADAATAYGNIKQAASESATGAVELATTAEVVTGTDTTRAVTAAGVKAHLSAPQPIGDGTPNTGAFTTLAGSTGTFTGDVVQGAGQLSHRTAVGAVDYNPSILTGDFIVAMTDTAAARACTISTEDVASGSTDNPRMITVVDESGVAGTNNITVSLETGTINGAANVVIATNYGIVRLYLDGTNGFVV